MIKIEKYHLTRKPSDEEIIQFVDFLHNHLDQFGDSVIDIKKAIDYALSGESGKGGFLLAGYLENELVFCVVMNRTGMEGYIPENILVYIATHRDHRGKGIAKELLNEAISEADGNIALHVEPDNPARYLYEKMGFTNKYLEMRLQK
jgi:GNAT superfamily N-acetyltransferase